MASLNVYRCRNGLTFHLPDFDFGCFFVISIHDTHDDVSWMGIMPSFNDTKLTVEIPEPCLSGHSFDILVYLCEQLWIADRLVSTYLGLYVTEEWFETIEPVHSGRMSVQVYPAWGKQAYLQ